MKDPERKIDFDRLKDLFLEDMAISPTEKESPDNASFLSSDGSDPAGMNTLGSYLLVHELGRGSSGHVFSAIHHGLQKKVALKVFSTRQNASKALLDRFRKEAVTAARLNHPNLVEVHDIGVHDGHHFMAMDLVDGETLDTWLKNESPSLERRLDVMEKITRAVAYLHDEGVIHRDLKPHNIMIDEKGNPVLVDFGLACALREENAEHNGALIGTPPYMAPEQLRGRIDAIDSRTDLFALGAIFFEVLFLEPAFQGKTVDEILANIEERTDAVGRRDLPGNLGDVIRKLLQIDPELRYSSAHDLTDDLKRLRKGGLARHVDATLSMKTGAIFRKVLHHRFLAIAVVAVIALLSVGAWWIVHQKEENVRVGAVLAAEMADREIAMQLSSVLQETEKLHYESGTTEEEKNAIIERMESILNRIDDTTGTADAYRFFVHMLLNTEHGAPDFDKAVAMHPENPIIHLKRAQLELRAFARCIPWPSQGHLVMYENKNPFSSLSEKMDEWIDERLRIAHAALVRASQIYSANHEKAIMSLPEQLHQAYHHLRINEYDEAIKILETLLDVDDFCVEVYMPLAIAFCYKNDFVKAIDTAEKLIEKRPNLILAKETAALSSAHAGFIEVASARMDPNQPPVPVKKLEYSIEILESLPGNIDNERRLGSFYQALGMYAYDHGTEASKRCVRLSIEAVSRVIANYKYEWCDYFNRGVTYSYLQTEEDMEKSVNDLKIARSMNPEDPRIQQSIVQVLTTRLGLKTETGVINEAHWHEAMQEMEKFSEMMPESFEYYYSLALLYQVQGEYLHHKNNAYDEKSLDAYSKALEELNRALMLLPDSLIALRLKNHIEEVLSKETGATF